MNSACDCIVLKHEEDIEAKIVVEDLDRDHFDKEHILRSRLVDSCSIKDGVTLDEKISLVNRKIDRERFLFSSKEKWVKIQKMYLLGN